MADYLIVIRSGATAYDLEDRIKGTLDIPLCREGVAEAERFAEYLSAAVPSAIYTSPSRCAVETGRIVGRRIGLRPRKVEALANLDQGLWQGRLVAEIRQRQPRLHRQWQENPWAVAPPQGELLEECCDRVAGGLERLLRKHAEGRVAVVVPEPLERIIRWIVAAEPLGDLWERRTEARGVVELPLVAQWTNPMRERARTAPSS